MGQEVATVAHRHRRSPPSGRAARICAHSRTLPARPSAPTTSRACSKPPPCRCRVASGPPSSCRVRWSGRHGRHALLRVACLGRASRCAALLLAPAHTTASWLLPTAPPPHARSPQSHLRHRAIRRKVKPRRCRRRQQPHARCCDAQLLVQRRGEQLPLYGVPCGGRVSEQGAWVWGRAGKRRGELASTGLPPCLGL